MIKFLLRKSIILLVSLFTVITLTFILMHSVPGDPFTNEQALPEEVLAALRIHYGLDKPLIWQYVKYLEGILYFDFGPSLRYPGRTAGEIIAEGFPVSFILGVEALIFSIIGGLVLGTIASLYPHHWQDHLILLISVLGISIPSFLLGTYLQYFLVMKWDLLPVARWGTFSHTIMPLMVLGVFPAAFIARLLRTAMAEILNTDYIQMARAKGLGWSLIFFRHVMPNALVPIIAYLSPLAATVFIGSFVVEKIFGIPGMGQWLVSSITTRDYPVIMGITIFYSAILIFFVFISDLICCVLDPRIKQELMSERV